MSEEQQKSPASRRSHWHHVWHVALGMFLAVLVLIGGLLWYATTPSFANHVRKYLISTLEQSTGGRVTLGTFRWNLFHLTIEADNLTIHGLEAPGEVPYAHVDRLFLRAKLLSLFHPKIDLEYLEADHPVFHLIVYKDGTTNQPKPRIASTGKPLKTTLFNLAIGRTALNNGVLLLNQRAIPFNIAANDLSATVVYSALHGHYRAQLYAADISAQRGGGPPLHSKLAITADAGRNSLTVSSLKLTSGNSRLEASAAVHNFNDPAWSFQTKGGLDLRELDALAGVPGIEAGTLDLDLQGQGLRANLNVHGTASVTGASYRTAAMQVAGLNARTALHVTDRHIAITDLHLDLNGGAINGSATLTNWKTHSAAMPERGSAQFAISDLSLDSILGIVAPPKFKRIGFNSAATGTLTASWTGAVSNLTTDVDLRLAPTASDRRQVPLSGVINATYSHPAGAVTIRQLDAHTPGTTLGLTGALGVYPASRQSMLDAHLHATNLAEFDTLFAALGSKRSQALPVALHGAAQFDGTITGTLPEPQARGHLSATNFDLRTASAPQPIHIDSADATAEYTPRQLTITRASITQGAAVVRASGTLRAHRISTRKSAFDAHSVIDANASIQHAALTDLLKIAGRQMPVTGTLNLQLNATGALDNLHGGGQLSVKGGEAYGEPYHSLTAGLNFAGRQVGITNLLLRQDGGQVTGDGGYNLADRHFQFSVQGRGFELAHFNRLKNSKYSVAGALTFSAQGSGSTTAPQLRAQVQLSQLTLAGLAKGNLNLEAHTQGRLLLLNANAGLDTARLQLSGQASLDGNDQAQARLVLSQLNLDPFLRAFHVSGITAPSAIAGTLTVSGPLKQPRKLNGEIQLSQLAIALSGVHLKTDGPLHAVLNNGVLRLDPMHITGDDTDLRAQGRVGLFARSHLLSASLDGGVNVKLAQTISKNVTSSGHIDFHLRANGTTVKPFLTGQVNFKDVNFALNTFPNGISKLNGTLEFDQDRLQVKTLTGRTGGGLVTVAGFITYQQGIFGDITVTGKEIRIRYPAGVSSMVDTKLRLQGTSTNMLLSGNVELTRFVVSPNLDFASLAGGTNGISPPPNPAAFSNRIRLDVHVTSSPELDFQNSLAHLAGNIDLHVRGSVAQPSILGRISVTEGSATFAGTKYQLQHGDIYFTNPVRIEPVIDLDATTHVEDYDITIGLHGTTSKLSPTFRSEPPLTEQDIFSLLAMGRTQEEEAQYSQEQQTAGVNSTADALLGGAINATLSSRIQKLFGGGSVKIDPTFISGLGNATARITVQQQVSKTATLTYATNVNSTQEQLIQGEVQVTPSFSVVAVRDEVGVFSLIFKLHRRYH